MKNTVGSFEMLHNSEAYDYHTKDTDNGGPVLKGSKDYANQDLNSSNPAVTTQVVKRNMKWDVP